MNYFGRTDTGRKRENNEDSFGCFKIADNAALLVVCDGMGGEAGGAEASELALNSFVNEIKLQSEPAIYGGKYQPDDPEADIPALLDAALSSANFEVWQRAQDNPSLHGMGTTLVGVFVMTEPLRVWSVNIGDSRLYRLDGNGINQVTRDHSYVQYLVDTGAITPAEAEHRNDKNIITRAVGISVQAQADIKPLAVDEGEYLLLCSDGLSGMLTPDEIQGIAARPGATLEEKTAKLVSLANDMGGDDNITVVIIEF